jgi:signal peptidase II
MLRRLSVSALVVVFDQSTKWLATAELRLHEPVPVLSFCDLTLTHNTGAAFSFLNQASGWQRWLFVAIAVAVCLAILAWLQRLPARARWSAFALALVLGGALGNLWDRITLGYVVDFIDLYYGTWHWPAFNIADSAITIGALMLIFSSTLFSKPLDSRLST